MNGDCINCRWCSKRSIDYYPCSCCVGLHAEAEYYFFCLPDQQDMFGIAELARCRSCGRKVHITKGTGYNSSYKYIRCKCGNSLQAKVSTEEMIRRWNNKPPEKTKMWRVKNI